MENIKEGFSFSGKLMHYAVGALIEKEGKYFLVERANLPSGFALVAGHVDEGEDTNKALIREVKEEIGLKIIDSQLIFEGELDNNLCAKRSDVHHWHIFKCDISGKIKVNSEEVKGFGWYSKEEIKNLRLEKSWERLFRKIGILD